MRINPIQTSSQSPFRGMWGKAEHNITDVDKWMITIHNTILHYYPCKDESRAYIKERTSHLAEYVKDHGEASGEHKYPLFFNRTVETHKPLEFTRADLKAFDENPKSLSSEIYGRIAVAIGKNGLTRTVPGIIY